MLRSRGVICRSGGPTGIGDDVILVFDNYHEISANSALHAAFKAALAEVPPGSNVIVLSRADPPPAFAVCRRAHQSDNCAGVVGRPKTDSGGNNSDCTSQG